VEGRSEVEPPGCELSFLQPVPADNATSINVAKMVFFMVSIILTTNLWRQRSDEK